MEQRISLITVGVKNLTKMREYYEKVFLWKPASENENIVFYQLNGFMLSFYPEHLLAKEVHGSDARTGFKPFSLAINYTSTAEVDDIFSLLKQRGVVVLKEPEDVFWGGYSGYVSDPENNLWEICYNPFMNFDQNMNVIGQEAP